MTWRPNPLVAGAVKDPARRLDNLPVSRTTELGSYGATLGMPFQLFDRLEDSLDETARGLEVVESDIIRDRVQISQRWLCRNYLSHRAAATFPRMNCPPCKKCHFHRST